MIIVLEGCDGCGKTTQQQLLAKNLSELGLKVAQSNYPSYSDKPYGSAVTRYLQGGFGPVAEVDPHLSGLLYAGDRLEQKQALYALTRDNDIVVLSRYYPSTYAYQGARVPDNLLLAYWDWLSSVEFESHGIQKADIVIYLDVPTEITTQRLAAKKNADLHEIDEGYQTAVRSTYRELVKRYGWFQINCEARSKPEIAQEILSLVEHVLIKVGFFEPKNKRLAAYTIETNEW